MTLEEAVASVPEHFRPAFRALLERGDLDEGSDFARWFDAPEGKVGREAFDAHMRADPLMQALADVMLERGGP